MGMLCKRLYNVFMGDRAVFGGVLIGVAIICSLLLVFTVFPGYGYVTVGRVTFFVKDVFTGFLNVFALIISLCSILFIFVVYGFGAKSVVVSFGYAILYFALFAVNKVLVAIPLYVFIATIVSIEWRNRVWVSQFFRGILYSIAGLEIAALARHISLLTGFRLSQLSPIASFEAYLWAFSWPLTLALLLSSTLLFLASTRFRTANHIDDGARGEKESKILLLLALFLSIAISFIGYLPTVNPYRQPLNVDWIFYYNDLQELGKSNNVLNLVFNPPASIGGYFIRNVDRPLYLLLLYILSKILPLDAKTICIYHNIALMLMYTFSLYFMAKRLFGEKVAVYTALIAPVTPHALSFLYGGFQADLFTLSLIQIAVGLAFDSKTRAYVRLPAIALLSTVATMTHVYTWTQYLFSTLIAMASTLALAIYSRLSGKRGAKNLIQTLLGLASFLVPGIAMEIALRMFSASRRIDVAWLIMQALPMLRRGVDINGLWSSAEFYTNIYTGGSLNTPLYWLIFAASSLYTPATVFGFSFAYLPILASIGLYSTNPLYAYRVTINIPTAPLTAYLISKLDKESKALLVLALYSLAIGKILGFIPGLQP